MNKYLCFFCLVICGCGSSKPENKPESVYGKYWDENQSLYEKQRQEEATITAHSKYCQSPHHSHTLSGYNLPVPANYEEMSLKEKIAKLREESLK